MGRLQRERLSAGVSTVVAIGMGVTGHWPPLLAVTCVVFIAFVVMARERTLRVQGAQDVTSETSKLGWKQTVLPWLALAAVLTSDYWFWPVYRAVPMGFWMLLLSVGFVFGVWRWIAFFGEKWRA